MNEVLTRLGVPVEVQALFNIAEPVFDYGDCKEVFAKDFHFVPASQNIWMAGNNAATDVLIARSAMECVAYLTLNALKYRNPEKLCFIALGNRPTTGQLNWVGKNYRKRKFTLLFEADLAGRVTDIFVAAGLKALPVKFQWTGQLVKITHKTRCVLFKEDELTLNTFEQAFSTRMAIRTRKRYKYPTFLDQLRYDEKR